MRCFHSSPCSHAVVSRNGRYFLVLIIISRKSNSSSRTTASGYSCAEVQPTRGEEMGIQFCLDVVADKMRRKGEIKSITSVNTDTDLQITTIIYSSANIAASSTLCCSSICAFRHLPSSPANRSVVVVAVASSRTIEFNQSENSLPVARASRSSASLGSRQFVKSQNLWLNFSPDALTFSDCTWHTLSGRDRARQCGQI